jgi:signal transduction histidine kinase
MTRLRQVRAAASRHPHRVDAGVAALLAALVIQEVLTSDVTGPPALLVPGAVATALPLAWRRSAPLASVAAVMLAFATVSVLDDSSQEPQTPLIVLLLAAYSVAAHAERRKAITGLGLSWAAILITEPGDFIVLGPVLAGTWFAGRLVRARDQDARRLTDLTAALERERVEEARIAAAEERARIARELHDVIAHAMSTIVLEAGAERVNLPSTETTTHDALRSIERTGRLALEEMRRLVGVLRRPGDEQGVAPQPSLEHLDELIERVRRAGLSVELEIVGEPVELAPGLDISAYRIVQEALTNVLKHAGDARARVVVSYSARAVEVRVADDGRGGTPDGSGHGLVGLRERVAMFGGEFQAGSREGGGFGLRARLPIDKGIP